MGLLSVWDSNFCTTCTKQRPLDEWVHHSVHGSSKSGIKFVISTVNKISLKRDKLDHWTPPFWLTKVSSTVLIGNGIRFLSGSCSYLRVPSPCFRKPGHVEIWISHSSPEFTGRFWLNLSGETDRGERGRKPITVLSCLRHTAFHGGKFCPVH